MLRLVFPRDPSTALRFARDDTNSMTFGTPQWFWGLLLFPLLIALFVRAEQRGLQRLQEFVSARLLPQLAGTVNRPRRILRFGLQLLGLALAIASLAQP